MKTTVQVLFLVSSLLFTFSLSAQIIPPGGLGGGGVNTNGQPQYSPDQLLVSYVPGTAESIKQQVRDRYDITSFEDVNGELEIWRDIDFPLTVTDDDGNPVLIHDVNRLIADLDITNGATGNPDDVRSQVNGGDLNYSITLPSQSTTSYYGPPVVLPYCPSEDYRLVGTLGSNVPANTQVVIMDQLFDINSPHTSGIASHSDKVAHVIESTADDAGLNVTFINVPIFNQNGESNYLGIIHGFKYLEDHNITNAVVNFSASMLVYETNFSMPVRNYINDVLNNNNLFLVSSAGNGGLSANVKIFPGGNFFANEITVAGTEGCFSYPWASTNHNQHDFEIAAEAKNVVVPATATTWALDAGTSYSAPMVTSALIQLATHYPNFDPTTLKTRLLQKADQVASMTSTTQLGHVLNTTAATDFTTPFQMETSGEFAIDLESPGNRLSVAPNPFEGELTINLPTEFFNEDRVQLTIFNQLGQVVLTKELAIEGANIPLYDPILTQQPAGTYWLQLRNNSQQQTIMISKG